MAYNFLLFSLCSLYFIETAAASKLTGDIIGRLVKLEDSDSENKREIAVMKKKIIEMETRETQLLQEIDELKDKLATEGKTDEEIRGSEEAKPVFKSSEESRGTDKQSDQKKKRSVTVREAVETEVAFYATPSKHDILHLGQHQVIVFDQTVTNIGSAYNTHHGAFVAPVDGTYVFHVTLMGTLHNASSHIYVAYIDVDDIAYSQFYIVPYEQSSHMFVIELKSGSTVSVKNGRVDDGVVGHHYSAFSGFLLYQRYHSSAIVGK